MRAPIALLLAFASFVCAAAPMDGIYSCTINAGAFPVQSYVTINGHDDGQSIFSVAAVLPFNSVYGYGIGKASGAVFSGVTAFGLPFFLTANGATLSGNVGILVGSTPTAATVSCIKIF